MTDQGSPPATGDSHWQQVFDQAPGFICVSRGPAHVFEFTNRAFRQLFGRDDVIGKPVREVFPNLEGQGFFERLDKVYAAGRRHVAHGVIGRFNRPDGTEEVRRLDFIYAPTFDAQGQVSGIFCEGYDVTDGHQAQVALREREEQLRLATDAADIGLWDVDLLTDTLYWPARVKAMFGISPDVPVSLDDFYQGLHPEDAPAITEAFASAADPQRRAVYDVEYRVIGKEDGVVRWVAAKGRGMFDEAGRCVRVIGTAIDVTARKAAEVALLKSEEQLRDSARRKDQFIATLAHELRNPLAPLRNAIQLLDSGTDVTKLRDIMRRQVDHLVRLVDDLLEVSRISEGIFELRQEPVAVEEVVRNALETSDPLIRERGHRLTVELPSQPIWVRGDPVRLAQILSNLLNNAARYTPLGGRIEVHVRRQDDHCQVSVTDDGAGFDAEQARRMFEMFHRGKQSTGLGIGLALSRKLADMHNARLEGASPGPGLGARFSLRLCTIEPPPARAAVADETKGLQVRRALVIDDNIDAADTLELLLRHLGMDVRVAYDGARGLEVFSTYQPAVVFLDIGMPGMDGYEVARRMRQDTAQPRTTIVGLSGWGQQEDIARGRQAGFDHHLVKPAAVQALQALLAELPQ